MDQQIMILYFNMWLRKYNNKPSRYNIRATSKWKNPYRNSGKSQGISFQLDEVLCVLKKNPELEIKITEARKYGVQTLIDKLLQVFKYQEIEDPNAILWIREKTKFITFLANKLTDLYSDNKVQNVKTDQSIKISWEDNQDDLIDVTAEDIPTATPDKD